MITILLLPFMLAFAFLNRGRGSRFFDLTGSTTQGRLIAMGGMAFLTTLRYMPGHTDQLYLMFGTSFALLFFWCVFAWDALWGAAIGTDPNHSRLWGTVAMTIRMSLILPFYVFLWWYNSAPPAHLAYGASFLLMGLPYYLSGKFTPGKYVIFNAELAVGAIIGATTWFIG